MSESRRMLNGIQETSERALPFAFPDSSRQEQINMGEQVAEILDHPGFQALAHALHIHSDSLLRHRSLRKPDADGAPYADVIGHVRGLGEVVPIALGIVENGKDAAQALREEEEK